MKRQTLMMIITTSLIGLAFIGFSVDYAIRRDVMSNGGQRAASGDYRFEGTLGQAIIGTSISADYGICHGFWCPPTPTPTPTPIPTPTTATYRYTFDHIGIAASSIMFVILFSARWLYDVTFQLWGVA